MALLTKSSSYQRYIDRIHEYRSLTNKEQAFSGIQSRTETMLQELKSREDQKIYFYLLIGICGVSVLCSILSMFTGHWLIAIFLLIAPFFAWFYYSQTMRENITDQKEFDIAATFGLKQQVMNRIEYVKQGVHIKISRIHIVRIIYMVLFPILMVGFLSLLNSGMEVSQVLLLFIAFLLGSAFWYYYFKDELDELLYQEKELEEYLTTLILEGNEQSKMANPVRVALYAEEE